MPLGRSKPGEGGVRVALGQGRGHYQRMASGDGGAPSAGRSPHWLPPAGPRDSGHRALRFPTLLPLALGVRLKATSLVKMALGTDHEATGLPSSCRCCAPPYSSWHGPHTNLALTACP